MNDLISLAFQSLILTFCTVILAISWSIFISPKFATSRRDRYIIGQNLIMIAISFLGIFAFASDQPELRKVIIISHQLLFGLILLLIAIWFLFVHLVRTILHKPTGQVPRFSIIGTRYLINLTGMVSVVMCRFLLTKILISL